MTRTMLDSTSAANIPADAVMVAGYVDGNYAWSDADWARFPNAVKVRIAVKPTTNDGHVIDVEPGNWTDADSIAWVQMRRAAGVEPTIYCGNAAQGYECSELAAIYAASGVAMPQMWLADYDGIANVPPGYIAKQYADGPAYDTSVVADYWPGVDAAPSSGPDVPDAQSRIASARALLTPLVGYIPVLAAVDTHLQAAQEDLTS